jgi:hypothetical protein
VVAAEGREAARRGNDSEGARDGGGEGREGWRVVGEGSEGLDQERRGDGEERAEKLASRIIQNSFCWCSM